MNYKYYRATDGRVFFCDACPYYDRRSNFCGFCMKKILDDMKKIKGGSDNMANEQKGKQEKKIKFVDARSDVVFTVPDESKIKLTCFDGTTFIQSCKYLDDLHVRIDDDIYHIGEFAGLLEKNGAICSPVNGSCDYYEIYQIENIEKVDYAFMSYETAQGKIKRSDYKRMYMSVLSPSTTLQQLWTKHNADNRPFGQKMRSLSMSDIVVMTRNGEKTAHYTDMVGWKNAPEFFKPEKKRGRPPKPTNKNRESR